MESCPILNECMFIFFNKDTKKMRNYVNMLN